MLDIIFLKYPMFLLIFVRMNGMILFNPIFGRRNIPTNIKVGLAFFMALILTSVTQNTNVVILNIPSFVLLGLFEMMIGFAISLIMNMFLSSVLLASDIIDIQLGIGMSRIYDPVNNNASPVTGMILNSFMMLLFFVSNGHITLFKLLAQSVFVLPPGSGYSFYKAFLVIVNIFGISLTLALKLAFPIIAIEIISEIGLGIITRAVPHVNIFSVGIQIKLALGLLMLIAIAPFFGNFCDMLFDNIYSSIVKIISIMGKG
jgi:flagellar biosynthesis protein FliR